MLHLQEQSLFNSGGLGQSLADLELRAANRFGEPSEKILRNATYYAELQTKKSTNSAIRAVMFSEDYLCPNEITVFECLKTHLKSWAE